MFLTCSGFAKNNIPCACRRFVANADHTVKRPSLKICRDCRHSEACHRVSTQPAHDGQSASRTLAVTRKVINPAKKLGDGVGNDGGKGAASTSSLVPSCTTSNSPTLKPVKVGTIVMVPCGLDANGELVQSKSPSMQQLEKYMQSSLAVDHDGDRELEFGLGWDQSAFDDWLRRLLPKPFEWLDMRFGRPESGTFHWVLLRKNRSRLFVVKRDVTTGVQVSAVKGTTGRKFTDYSVRIASRHGIPKSAYSNWVIAIQQALDGQIEQEATDDELGSTVNTAKTVKKEAGSDSDKDSKDAFSNKTPKATSLDSESESEPESVSFGDYTPVTSGRKGAGIIIVSDSEVQIISDDSSSDEDISSHNPPGGRKRVDSSKTNNQDVQVKRQKVQVSASPPSDGPSSWEGLGVDDVPDYFTDWGIIEDIPQDGPSSIVSPSVALPPPISRAGFTIPGQPQHNPWK